MCQKVHDLVYSDRRFQVAEIAQALCISHGSVLAILHGRLGMRKLTAHWVPKSLSNKQMATTTLLCSALLKRFMSKDDFVLRLVTIDETWVHDRQFVGPGSPRPNSQDTTICWQGDGHSILGRKRRYYI